MIKPILACHSPYEAARRFESAGWRIDFSNPPESGDPLVGVSLCGNAVLLGITAGYVPAENRPYIGCGVEIYLSVPQHQIQNIFQNHQALNPTPLTVQPWGETAFEVTICGFRFLIASEETQ